MMTPRKIRSTRKAMNLNLTQFAARVGVTEQAIRRWEAGERFPKPKWQEKLERLAKKAKIAV
jgi:transcriptional regulator with XRE-family HTH domain